MHELNFFCGLISVPMTGVSLALQSTLWQVAGAEEQDTDCCGGQNGGRLC